ncbi:carbonic anhydrase 9 isoform X2 [Sceloporus undulatus]|nr:carbonic anhydrase 9 isoform X2 [Sceloporus undulatus]
MQSPIDIEMGATLYSPHLTPVQLSGYNLPHGERLRLKNNGHTIVLDLPGNMSVSGGGFPFPYQAAQLHLHWGSKHALEGSEHTVDGHRFAGELHVVHYNTHFGTIKEAAREPGGLAVLAAFLQVGSEENESYQHILEHLEDIREEGEETFINGFDIAQLLPQDLGRFFRYNGSLTTPPCFQTVNWTIFNQTLRLSPEQISVLEDTIQGDEDQPLQSNFRLPQSLHGRTVLASFPLAPTARRAPLPGQGAPPSTPIPHGPPEEGDGGPPPGEGEEQPPSPPEEATGGDPSPASEEGANHSLGSGAAEQTTGSSLQRGDILAILFGCLFGLTALAFLCYIRKHPKNQEKQRLATPPGKSGAIYTPAASTEENAV